MNHVSIRVPWHDNGWNGRYCLNPSCNTFCKVLSNIALNKKETEDVFANQEWGKLPKEEWPACYGENGGFEYEQLLECNDGKNLFQISLSPICLASVTFGNIWEC